MSNTYTDTPIANHTLAFDQPTIEANFLYLANTLGTSLKAGDHQIALSGVDTTQFEGRHRQVCLNNRNALPPTVAGISDGVDSIIYSDNGNIFFGTSIGAGNFKMTPFNATTLAGTAKFGTTNNGWTFLPGALILQYGVVITPRSGVNDTVLFATNGIDFPNNLFSVFFNFARSNSATGTDNFWINDSNTFDKTRFSWKASTNSADFLYWVALGN